MTFEEQLEIGKELGHDEVAAVVKWLLDNGRDEDVLHLAKDKNYRKLIISEYSGKHPDNS